MKTRDHQKKAQKPPPTKPSWPQKPKRRWFRWLVAFLSLGLFGVVLFVGGILWVFWEYGRDLPEYRQLAKYEPPITTRVHAGNGALLAEYAIERRIFVPTNDIPDVVIAAFLAAEDKSFYRHFGVDPKALARAGIVNIINRGKGKRPVGASTITQQVAKNFLLSNELSYERKIREAILAIRMERAFTKDQILGLYLNEIYLGFGSYGVASAALNYFDKSLDEMTLAEAAYLAALPKAPNNYHPKRKYKNAINRRNWVLQRMVDNGYISQSEAKAAASEPIITHKRSGVDGAAAPYFAEAVRRQMIKSFGEDVFYTGGLSIRTTIDPDLQKKADKAMIEGLEALDKRQGWRGAFGHYSGGFSDNEAIAKTLNAGATKMVDKRYAAIVTEVFDKKAEIIIGIRDGKSPANKIIIERGEIPFALADWAYPPRDENNVRPAPITSLKQALKKGDVIMVQRPADVPDRLSRIKDPAVFDDKTWALGQRPLVEGAIIALDPHTGRILAMTGGYNASESEFNRATQAQRQPGSAFKPFVYIAALDNGFAPTTLLLDAPIAVDQGPNKPKWKPANYTKKFYGPSIMRLGLEQSRNLMTARLAMAVGMPKIQDYAARFGVQKDMPPYLSMSLGAGETSLINLTAAYGMIVNGGHTIQPSMIDRVQDRYGKTVIKIDQRQCRKCNVDDFQAITKPPKIADNRDQITHAASAYQMVSMMEGVVKRGTARRIGNPGFAVAGKTGTTNDNTNAWFIGFTPDLVVGVYVGYDVPRPLGVRETATTAAVPIFSTFIRQAMQGKPSIPFRRPKGVNLYTIDATTGERAKAGDDNTITEIFKPGQRPLNKGERAVVIDVPNANALGANDASVAQPLDGLY